MGPKDDISAAVVLIEGNEECDDPNAFGTGFAVRREGNDTWIVTCAHVLEDIGGVSKTQVRYCGQPYSVTLVEDCCGAKTAIDLALLKVSGLAIPALSLLPDGRRSDEVRIVGFAEQDGRFVAEPVWGELGDQYALEAAGRRLNAWQLVISGDVPLKAGYSGSPVVRTDTQQVVAVTTHLQKKGEAGHAIHIAHLADLGSSVLPADLLKGETFIVWERCRYLKGLIQDTDITRNQLRLFAHLALPLVNSYEIPHCNTDDLVDWLAGLGVDDGWCPLLSLARQLLEEVHRDLTRSNLHLWISKTAEHFGIEDIWQQSLTHDEKTFGKATGSPVLLPEIIDRNSSDEPYTMRFFYHLGSRRIPVELDEDTPPSLSPPSLKERSELAAYLNKLLYRFFMDRSAIMLTFIVPDELLSHRDLLRYPIEEWAYPDDDLELEVPLGVIFPVVVRPSSRQYSGDFDDARRKWIHGWKRQKKYCGTPVMDTLCWLTPSEHQRQLLTQPDQGRVCVALAFVPDDHQILGRVIKRGITAALWSRHRVVEDRFQDAVEKRLGETPLGNLPHTMKEIRSDAWGAEDFDHPCYHLSLLWDDPDCCLPNLAEQHPGLD